MFDSSQINSRTQTITIKARRFFHGLLQLCNLFFKLPYLIVKFKYGFNFHDRGKKRVKRVWGNNSNEGLKQELENHEA